MQTKNNNAIAYQEDGLPLDTTKAMHTLIKITEQLCTLAEKETQALVRNDTMIFAILQQEKDLLSRRYAQASAEFRARLDEFRTTDRNLLGRLEVLQKKLSEKTVGNNTIVERMHKRARQQTQGTLITAQELAQKHQVYFADNMVQQEGA
jgi:hypothetical protein